MSYSRQNTYFQKWLAIFILAELAIFVAPAPQVYAAEYFLIANKSVAVDSLAKNEARSIFLGNMTRWDDGKAVKFAVLGEERISRSFMQDVVGKTPQQYLNYWRRKIFNGEALAPKTFSTTEAAVKFVATTSGAIGYVSVDKVSDNVKILRLDR